MNGPHGLVLTGGASSRMGTDKATVRVGGLPMAVRAARALVPVARPVLVVGREAGTGLDAVSDPGRGPLAAFVAGADALAARGCAGAILLVACDLPFVSAALLGFLARALGDADAAVPVAGARDQPLAACYSVRAAVVARELVSSGQLAMRDLLAAVTVARIPEPEWTAVAPAEALADVDTPADLERARAADEGTAGPS